MEALRGDDIIKRLWKDAASLWRRVCQTSLRPAAGTLPYL